MKRLFVVVVLVLVLAVGWRSYGSPETGTGNLTLPQPAPNEGENVQQFTAETLKGDKFRLSEDGAYVLTFWSTLNQGSSMVKEDFSRMAREYADEDVTFAAVYVSNIPDDYGEVPYNVLLDSSGKLTSIYNVKRVPRIFVIKNDEIELVLDNYYNNYYEENKKVLKETIEAL